MLTLDRPDAIPSAGPAVWVRRLKSNEVVQFSCASPAIWQYFIHWDGNNRLSLPCTKPHAQCVGHRRVLPRKWKGYLYGINHQSRQYEFLEVTPDGAKKLLALVGDQTNFRGQRFSVRRGNGEASRLSISLLPDWQSFSQGKLHDDKDPTATLLRLWGVEDVPDNNMSRPSVAFSD